MNARKVHHLMLHHFPKPPASIELVNAADAGGLRRPVIERLIEEFIAADELLVEINRHLGGYFPKAEAIDFIIQHGVDEIHGAKIADRAFTGLVYVYSNGVAGGFKVSPPISNTQAGS